MVDHINRNKTDNRWANLRQATHRENMGNMGLRRANTSGFVGVVWDRTRGKWRAQIRLDGKKTNLGRFDDPIQAAMVHDEAARRNFGEFATLNFGG